MISYYLNERPPQVAWTYRVSVAGVIVDTAYTLPQAEKLARDRMKALGAQGGRAVVIWAEVA